MKRFIAFIPSVTISYTQIAWLYGISMPCARSYIKRDLQMGLIFSKNFNWLPWKQVSCYLTPFGYSHLHKDLATPAPRESY
ncbi:hypothetical protein [Candidatus Neptunichlamydia sp. REUL1]|uniref:hypothetical protein n=1 Tax=Candidatus Neptunichlamydia sp. REUL1 TaxID=3064277 RepID=UPI0029309029|nr:hypothetical protein [Candidatus Neptunochlamydia sp. REUL1]